MEERERYTELPHTVNAGGRHTIQTVGIRFGFQQLLNAATRHSGDSPSLFPYLTQIIQVGGFKKEAGTDRSCRPQVTSGCRGLQLSL
jgi:hypothetical protein